ncbi:MAG TPA: MFS transporter [Pseudolabrys sp.]|nr:MFS transporter [Pseudolabrys sp.]
MTDAKRAAHETVETAKHGAEKVAGGPARLQVILVLAAVLALDTADKATVSAVASSLKSAFHISNTEIGILIACTSFAGAVLTLPIGSLVDHINRKRVLLVTIALWTAATVVSGTATSFLYLLITRLFLGAVTASASPAVASLTGDFFPAGARAKIYGMILTGELVGTGVGFFVSGEVSAWFDWRWSFYVMAIPSLIILWAIWRYLEEPARGGQSWIALGQEEVPSQDNAQGRQSGRQDQPEGGQSEESAQAQEQIRRAGIQPREDLVLHEDPRRRSIWWAVGYLLHIPTYVLLIIASSLGYYFFAGIRGFAMIYLTQHYGLSRSTLSGLIVIIGLGAIAGLLLGGRLTRYMRDRGMIQSRILVPGVALFISVLLIAPAMWTTSAWIGITLLTFGAGALAAANPPIDAARLDIVPAFLWGRGEAGRMALRALLEGGAPILFGAVSSWFGGGNSGLEWTYLVMLIPVLVAASLAIPAYRTYPRDVATARASAEALNHRS